MKYILIIVICFLGLTATSQVQKQGRSNFPTVVDSSLAIGKNFILPVFRSFSQLATYTALDSSGRLVFIRDSNAVFYRTNAHTWAKLSTGSGSGSVAWGSITGTLSNQTDLQTVLDSKVDSVILRGGDSLYNHYATGEVQFIGLLSGGASNDTLRVRTPLKVTSNNDTLYQNQVSDVDSGWVSPDQKVFWDLGGMQSLQQILQNSPDYPNQLLNFSGGFVFADSLQFVQNLYYATSGPDSGATGQTTFGSHAFNIEGTSVQGDKYALFAQDAVMAMDVSNTISGHGSSFTLDTTKAVFMTRDSTIKVGINTVVPTAALQIAATDSNILRLNPSGLWAVGATTDSLLSIDNSGRVHKRVIPTPGSGTVTSIATGYGLSGGTITTTGTLLVDSAALSLKYLRRGDSILNGGYTSLYQYNKGKDSLQTNINLKANIASPTFTGSPVLSTSSATSLVIGGTLGSSSLFDVQSTTKGILIPRMTTTQRDAISSAGSQLLITNTTTNNLDKYNGTEWEPVSAALTDAVLAMNGGGSPFIAETVGMNSPLSILGSTALGSGGPGYCAIYINKRVTLTGAAFFMATQGNFTGNNVNSIGLYSYSGGTITKIAETANDPNIWKNTSSTWVQVPFSSTVAVSAGIYFLAVSYSSSAQTTAPALGRGTTILSAVQNSPVTTNSFKFYSYRTGQTSLPSTESMSNLTAWANPFYLAVY